MRSRDVSTKCRIPNLVRSLVRRGMVLRSGVEFVRSMRRGQVLFRECQWRLHELPCGDLLSSCEEHWMSCMRHGILLWRGMGLVRNMCRGPDVELSQKRVSRLPRGLHLERGNCVRRLPRGPDV
jgi:hypothetical protein